MKICTSNYRVLLVLLTVLLCASKLAVDTGRVPCVRT